MSFRRESGILGVLMILASGALATGIPDLSLCTLSTSATVPVGLLVCPAGDGDVFPAARELGGGSEDATLTLVMLDGMGSPIYMYPAEDVWLEAEGAVLCPGGGIPDGHTGADGKTYWTHSLHAGGASGVGEMRCYINGSALIGPGVDIVVNSPDINGDLTVNLSDVIAFTEIYAGPYDYRIDFYWDGVMNISDVVELAGHLAHQCP